jgi:PAS domain S-box-containing protein
MPSSVKANLLDDGAVDTFVSGLRDDALPGLVWTALPDGHIDFVNQRWCEYTGLSAADARGRGWLAAVHGEDLPELLERWRSILASGESGEMEARLRRSDGEYCASHCPTC